MSQNYHKAALGGGVAVLAIVGYLSWSKGSELQAGFESDASAKKSEDASVPGGEVVDDIITSIKNTDPLEQNSTSEGRPVDLFTSVDLFVANGNIDSTVDLLDPDLPPVHPPIPNPWWVNNNVDPSFSDALERDQDSDGFSNLEEFEAETNPSDPKDYPLLVHKLAVKEVDSTYWLLELNSSLGNDDFQFRYNDSKNISLRMSATNNVESGDVFFSDGPKKGRFKVIKKIEKEVEEKGRKVKKTFATVEDLKPNKGNIKFDVPLRPKKDKLTDFYRFDNTVTFILNAVGQEGKEIVVEENTTFKVTADGKTIEYKLVEVDMGERPNVKPLAAIVEYDDEGEKKTRRIEIN